MADHIWGCTAWGDGASQAQREAHLYPSSQRERSSDSCSSASLSGH